MLLNSSIIVTVEDGNGRSICNHTLSSNVLVHSFVYKLAAVCIDYSMRDWNMWSISWSSIKSKEDTGTIAQNRWVNGCTHVVSNIPVGLHYILRCILIGSTSDEEYGAVIECVRAERLKSKYKFDFDRDDFLTNSEQHVIHWYTHPHTLNYLCVYGN